MERQDGHGKVIFTHLLAASLFGFIVAAATHYRRIRKSKLAKDQNPLAPRLVRTESGHLRNLERFSHYVARQIGFEDPNECPQLCKLANEYLRKSKGCEASLYEFCTNYNGAEAESLYVQLVEEIDTCVLSYFAFHWSQASSMIKQVLSVDSEQKAKLKNLVMTATRKRRFEKVTTDLKVTRVFSTLVEEMKAINGVGDSQCTDVMKPVALSERSPVLLLMGGGMGAGKSTVLKDILKDSFWSGAAAANAVVVEADAFKETDVVYKALNSMGHHHDMLQTAELVHQSSTDAASSLLVTALNEGRDVIMDGTLSWVPFVEQTIAMARNVHKCRYRMGVGYKVAEDGTVTENYWEQVEEEEEEEEGEEQQQKQNGEEVAKRKPYRIEMVGVVCDPYLAVVRGIRRAVMVGRAVRVNSQLKSHKRFAAAFPIYCQLVDNARLYCTNAIGGPPTLVGWKDGDNKLLVDQEEIKCLTILSELNDDADSILELYANSNPTTEPGSIWKEVVLSASRSNIQQEIKASIQKIELSTTDINSKPTMVQGST